MPALAPVRLTRSIRASIALLAPRASWSRTRPSRRPPSWPWLAAIADHPKAGPLARALLTAITEEEPRDWSSWLRDHGQSPRIKAVLAPLRSKLAGAEAEAEAARREILALGRRAIPSLLSWLDDAALALDARRILAAMTGAQVDDWRAWWATNKARVDDRGRLEAAPPPRAS